MINTKELEHYNYDKAVEELNKHKEEWDSEAENYKIKGYLVITSFLFKILLFLVVTISFLLKNFDFMELHIVSFRFRFCRFYYVSITCPSLDIFCCW